MAQRVIQASFNSGEIAPALFARTDLNKYHSGAALLRNFFVDYRGGASTRPGTRFIDFAQDSTGPVRLIPFQASTTVNYVLEFGGGYIRFIANGARVTHADGSAYGIASPYAAADLALLKYAQSVSTMLICHPNYPPQTLTLIASDNWTIAPTKFGSTSNIPAGLGVTPSTSLSASSATTASPANCSYSYIVTSVSASGQESAASAAFTVSSLQDMRVTNGTNRVTWNAVPGAARYNVYKADIAYFDTILPGVQYGYIGFATGTTFDDSNVGPDFGSTPPLFRDVLNGSSATAVSVTTPGSYNTVPAVTLAGNAAQAPAFQAALVATSLTLGAQGQAYTVGDIVTFPNGQTASIASTGNNGRATSINWNKNSSTYTTTNPPTGQMASTSNSNGNGVTAAATYGLSAVQVVNPGDGIDPAATLNVVAQDSTSTGGGAVALSLSPAGYGNPAVPAFFQQRLFLGGPTKSPANFNLSQPGNYYNFNVSEPAQADDSITGTLASSQLNSIKHALAVSSGLIVFTDRATWLVTGGSNGSAVSPSTIVANEQSRVGSSDLPPIVSNFDILYVQAKGSVIRDSTYNIYANVYTGQDITAIASHLFYGYTIAEWASAEEPFKLIWCVRSDGTLLTLTFLKEQELIAWAHSDSAGGVFKSVCTVPEMVGGVLIDAVYFVVQRTVNGQSLKCIERLSERQWSTVAQCTCVDSFVQYQGNPATQFSNAQNLGGQTVTGLADGVPIPPFVMPASGQFALSKAASLVTIGLPYICQLQTLALDVGDPTIQSKMKKINSVTLRLQQAMGLKMGSSFSRLVPMKDTILGNVGGMSNTTVTDLVTCDCRTILDPTYTVPGQYTVQQDQPYPATILGVIPDFTPGDVDARR